MTTSQAMLAPIQQVASRLEPEALSLLKSFLESQWMPEGASRGRGGTSDLYYTVFLLACHRALNLGVPPPNSMDYLNRFDSGQDLDFIHRVCLARCRGLHPDLCANQAANQQILAGLEDYRCADGGYNQQAFKRTQSSAQSAEEPPKNYHATIYDGFLALLAYEESGWAMPRDREFANWVGALRTEDGSFGGGDGWLAGTTPVTAAAVVLRQHLGQDVPAAAGNWLLARHHPQGGFLAAPGASAPDLLSTATALHALSVMQQPLGTERQACLAFVESLWSEQGGFFGDLSDDEADVEYTYYGLLALGHLMD